jgi:hypothetical protein
MTADPVAIVELHATLMRSLMQAQQANAELQAENAELKAQLAATNGQAAPKAREPKAAS